MRAIDLVRNAAGSIFFHRLRSGLTMLGILIGIASVILLTSIGEGTRSYVIGQFTQFGTNIMAINPGADPDERDAGLARRDRAQADDRRRGRRPPAPGRRRRRPAHRGNGARRGRGRARNVLVVGVTSDVPAVFNFQVRQGTFIPPGDPRAGTTVAVLAPKLKRELFGEENALGEHVRVGGRRFRVIGVMEPKGELLGFDLDDRVYVPVSQAQTLFNTDGLWEIDLKFSINARSDEVVREIRRTIKERHRGEEDFTITTQTEMLDVFGRVLGIVSVAVSGIAAISLVVGAIGILTMMWIGVNERTPEIGLALAIGASRRQVLSLFLAEATLLATLGGGAAS
jgi:putative ABC transport system permease protein